MLRQGIAALFGKPYRGLKSFSAILLGLDARFFNRSEMGRRGGSKVKWLAKHLLVWPASVRGCGDVFISSFPWPFTGGQGQEVSL